MQAKLGYRPNASASTGNSRVISSDQLEELIMAFANPNVSDIIATCIESRTKRIADNV